MIVLVTPRALAVEHSAVARQIPHREDAVRRRVGTGLRLATGDRDLVGVVHARLVARDEDRAPVRRERRAEHGGRVHELLDRVARNLPSPLRGDGGGDEGGGREDEGEGTHGGLQRGTPENLPLRPGLAALRCARRIRSVCFSMSPTQLKRESRRIAYGQVRLAEKLGVNPSEVRHWLAGDDPVPAMVALDIRNLPSHNAPSPRRRA